MTNQNHIGSSHYLQPTDYHALQELPLIIHHESKNKVHLRDFCVLVVKKMKVKYKRKKL